MPHRHPAISGLLLGLAAGAFLLILLDSTSPRWLIDLLGLPLSRLWYVGPALLLLGSLGRFATNPGPVYRWAQVIGAGWVGAVVAFWTMAVLTCAMCSDQ